MSEEEAMMETIEAIETHPHEHGHARAPPPWRYFAAGEIAGVCSVLVSHPFDTLKVQMQTNPHKFKGMVDCARFLARRDGVAGMYRGMASPLLGQGVLFSLVFGVQNVVCDQMRKANGDPTIPLSPLQMTIAGGIAGYVTSYPRTAIERVKCWSQHNNISTPAAISQLFKTQGIRRGFFTGLVATQAREVPQFSMYFITYETILSMIEAEPKRPDVPASKVLFAGATTGVLSWIATYPCDVVKTNLQTARPGEYRSLRHCVSHLYRTQGPMVFWRGLVPACVRAVPLHGAIFLVFERALTFIDWMASRTLPTLPEAIQ